MKTSWYFSPLRVRQCKPITYAATVLVASVGPLLAQSGFYGQVISCGSFESTGARSGSFLIGNTGTSTNRAYIPFHLPRFAGQPQSARLSLSYGWLETPENNESLQIREVLAPEWSVYSLVTNGLAVFGDLGDGRVFGTQSVTNTGSSFTTEFELNASALTTLAAHSGTDFVLGLELPGAEIPGMPRFFSFPTSYAAPQLWLQFDDTSTPVILDTSPECVSAFTNSPAQLWVSAHGAPTLAYQWFRDGAPVAGGTGSSLTVTTEAPGQYWAVVSNGLGAVLSAVTRVIINESVPVMYYQPNIFNQYMAGTTIDLYTTVSGSEPLALQWFFNGNPLPGQTSMNLFLSDCRVEHSGFYWLTASNHAGFCSSYAAQVTVNPLEVTIYGSEAYAGSIFYLRSGTTTYAQEVGYQWRRDGTNLPGANAATLTFTNLSATDLGNYDLVAWNVYGSRTSIVYTLTPIQAAPWVENLSCPSNTATGRELVISGRVSGSQPLSMWWEFEGTPVAAETNDTLIISAAQPAHSGMYTLVASNAFGVATRSSYVVISGQAPGMFYLSGGPGWPGRPCLIRAETDYYTPGVPGSPSEFRWMHDGIELKEQTNYFLVFTNFALADAGIYTLSASNAYGTAGASYSIQVLPRRALEQWTWKAPLPQGNDLHNAAFGNGHYVAIGDQGEVVHSADGVQWERTMYSVAGSVRFFQGEFLLLPWHYGAPWPMVAWVSPDGRDWTIREVSAQEIARADSVYGNGTYSSGAMSSTDGVHWRAAAPEQFSRIAFGNGRVVGLSYTWGLGYGFWTSTDGFAWFLNPVSVQLPLRGLAFGNGRFVAVGEDGFAFTSVDGITWTSLGRVVSRDINDVLFDGRQFVACGNRGLLLTSTDGVAWTVRAGEREDLFGVVFAQNRFVAVGDQGSIFSSPDGVSWTARYSGTSRDLHGVTYGNGLFVAVGRRGMVLTSPDGIVWTARATSTASYLERVSYGDGKFIAVGNTPPTILTSANAFTWQMADLSGLNLPADVRLEGAACGNGLMLAVGGHFLYPVNEVHAIPDLLVSSNGVAWGRRPAPQVPNDGRILRNITFAAGKFVVVGNDGLVSWSADASTWSPGQSYGPNLRAVKYSDATARFVAVGNSGNVVSVRDAVPLAWNRHMTDVAQNFHDLAFGFNRFVAVGNGGTIVQSGLGTPVFAADSQPEPRFTIQGGIEETYTIETATELGLWTPSCVFTNLGVPWRVDEPMPAEQRFFRAVSP